MPLGSQHRSLLAWLGFAGLSLATAMAGPSSSAEQEYRVTSWTAENGLPQNTIKALAQTPDGYLWIGTLVGLARFDGLHFNLYDHNNTRELLHDSIDDLAVDTRDGSLWIGTGAGLVHYSERRFERFGPEKGVPGPVGTLCAAREGGVWFCPLRGEIGLAHDGQVTRWRFGPESRETYVHKLAEESPGEIMAIVGDGHRLCRIDLSTSTCTPVPLGPGAGVCFYWSEDNKGSNWLCCADGLWFGKEPYWTRIALSSFEAMSKSVGLRTVRGGRYWFTQPESGQSGLCRVVGGQLESFSTPALPSDLNITALLEDSEEDLWIGSTMGLFRLQPKRVKVYARPQGLRNDEIFAVTSSPDDTVWLGTGFGISTIRGGQVTNLEAPDANGWSKVPVFCVDSHNRLWLGRNPQGLNLLDAGRWSVIRPPAEWQLSTDISATYEDHQGRLWVARRGEAFCQVNGSWTRHEVDIDSSHGDVRVIHQDRRGDMWFGTFGGGLVRLHAGSLANYRSGPDEYNNRAWWIHEDADGLFWIGTEAGLNRFVPPGQDATDALQPNPSGSTASPQFVTFGTREGLYEKVVNNIQEDQFGYLWLSGLHGIYRVFRQELNEVAEGKRPRVKCLALGEADGMLNSECNGGDNQPAGCTDGQGRIWFPTLKGVVVVDPSRVTRTQMPPHVAIEQILANNIVVWGDDNPQFRHNDTLSRDEPIRASLAAFSSPFTSQARASPLRTGAPSAPTLRLQPGSAHVLEIRYTANTLAAPERTRFRYRLEGCDPDWQSDDENRRMAVYTNLKPGSYSFRVIACNNEGAWNEQGASLPLFIAPHFYETTMFYAACVIVVILAAWAIHYARIKGLSRVQRLERELALDQERARIGRDLHDDLGSRFLQISVLGELSHRSADDPKRAREHLEKLHTTTASAFEALDEIVWAANPKQDSLEGLVSYLREYVPQFLGPLGIKFRLHFPHPLPVLVLSAELRHELFLVVKEALQNAAKHSHATEMSLRLDIEAQTLRLIIKDDGRGFCLSNPSAKLPDNEEQPAPAMGNGLENMRGRMDRLGGAFHISSTPGQGTEVILEVGL